MSKSYRRFYLDFIFNCCAAVCLRTTVSVFNTHYRWFEYGSLNINTYFFVWDEHLLRFRCAERSLCCGCLFLPLVYLAFLLLGRRSHFFFFLGDPVDPCSEPARSHLSSSKEAGGGGGGGRGCYSGCLYQFIRLNVPPFLGSNRGSCRSWRATGFPHWDNPIYCYWWWRVPPQGFMLPPLPNTHKPPRGVRACTWHGRARKQESHTAFVSAGPHVHVLIISKRGDVPQFNIQ